jgi:hypothetical protein
MRAAVSDWTASSWRSPARRRRSSSQVPEHRVVAGLGQVGDGAVQQFGLGAAEQVAQGAVDPQKAAVQADQRHPDGRLVETEAEVQSAPLPSHPHASRPTSLASRGPQ